MTSDKSVWAWGLNTVGQVGDGTTVKRLAPVRVTYSSPRLRVSFFCPCSTRLPLGLTRTTVAVMTPESALLWLALPPPLKS